MDFSTFENKYILEGNLVVLNGLHIGSGLEDEVHDDPFIKDGNGNYYIPGSSFRGYLSTKLERYLEKQNDFKLVDKSTDDDLNMADVKLIFGYTNLNKEENEIKERVCQKLNMKENEARSMAGKIHIEDMPVIVSVNEITRDGIKIDRDTGATANGAKFDYNILPAGSKFAFRIEMQNMEEYQMDLLFLALKDILDGDLFGGKLSRGIGKCQLDRDSLKLRYADKSNLKEYIFKGKMKEKNIDDILEFKNIDIR